MSVVQNKQDIIKVFRFLTGFVPYDPLQGSESILDSKGWTSDYNFGTYKHSFQNKNKILYY